MIKTNLGHEALEAQATFGAAPSQTEIIINDQDAIVRSAQILDTVCEAVLETSGFLITNRLQYGRLPDVHNCETIQVAILNRLRPQERRT